MQCCNFKIDSKSSTQSCPNWRDIRYFRGKKLEKKPVETKTWKKKQLPKCSSSLFPISQPSQNSFFFFKTRVPTKTFLGIWIAILKDTIAVIWIRLLGGEQVGRFWGDPSLRKNWPVSDYLKMEAKHGINKSMDYSRLWNCCRTKNAQILYKYWNFHGA